MHAMDKTALLIVDLQNDFVHPDGAYARGGQSEPAIAALPAQLKPLADRIRDEGGLIVATQFTLVPGRGGEPLISPHLKQLQALPAKGRFRARILGTGAGRYARPRGHADREGRLFGLLHDAARMGFAQDGH